MIDLHNHSNYSDGLYEPEKVVENAVRDGLSAIALCDHDCTWGLDKAKRKAEELNIGFVPGIELTVSVEGDKDHADEVHMLGLFIEPTEHLEDIHRRIKAAKDAFSFELAEAMRKYRALPIYVEDIRKMFHGAISMGAFGDYMVKKGLIEKFTDRKKITNELIAEGKMAPKPNFGISADEAIDAIHEAGGLAILAHPYRMKLDDATLFERIKQYKAMGLDGLECYYRGYKKDEEANIRKSLQIAIILGLLISGGSDYHRDRSNGRFPSGEGVSDDVLANLRRARIVQNAAYQRNLVVSHG